MLWEGIRVYSRSQYENLGPDNRFILTEAVRNGLHPEIPESYLNKSIVLVHSDGSVEIEVEGVNFLAVDDDVPDIMIISMREAERRYPQDVTECRLTGSTLIAKLFQDDQDDLISGTREPKSKKRVINRKAGTGSKDKPKRSVRKTSEKTKTSDPVKEPGSKEPRRDSDNAGDASETPAKKSEPAEPEATPVKKKAAVHSDKNDGGIWKHLFKK